MKLVGGGSVIKWGLPRPSSLLCEDQEGELLGRMNIRLEVTFVGI